MEIFCRTDKALTITGARIAGAGKLTDTDKLIGWAHRMGRAQEGRQRGRQAANGHAVLKDPEFGGGHDVEYIDQIIREGAPDGANRSDLFHTIVGHLLGVGMDAAAIGAKLCATPTESPPAISPRTVYSRKAARTALLMEKSTDLFGIGKGASAAPCRRSRGSHQSLPRRPLHQSRSRSPRTPTTILRNRQEPV